MIHVTRTSKLTGQKHTMLMPITCAELERIEQGAEIAEVLTHLTPPEREFLAWGTTTSEWEEHFGDQEEIVQHG